MAVTGMDAVFMVIAIVVGTLLMIGIIFAITLGYIGRMAKKNRMSADAEYPNARHIETSVNFFGQESRKATQMRGNGTMILTDDEIIFKQWVVNKVFRIPYRSITGIENPTSFLGKSQFVPLLKIVYTDEQGQQDSMAWRVRDLGELTRLINEGRGV